ncbi:MAG: hypothetical protein HRF40_11750 [Nitrososphaera sp.]|jgi:TRAP-type C4-dicarboxylate transport system permease small subunit
MQAAVLLVIALGVAIFLFGAWFNVGMFMSSSTPVLPLTGAMFAVAMTINGIGTGLIIYGISIRKPPSHALNIA